MQKDTSNRTQILQDRLDKAIRLNRIFQSEDFKVVLQPALQQASLIKFLNPLDYPSEEQFLRAYNLAYSRAQVYNELLNMMEASAKEIAKIKIELGQPEKNWSTGE